MKTNREHILVLNCQYDLVLLNFVFVYRDSVTIINPVYIQLSCPTHNK